VRYAACGTRRAVRGVRCAAGGTSWQLAGQLAVGRTVGSWQDSWQLAGQLAVGRRQLAVIFLLTDFYEFLSNNDNRVIVIR